MSEQSSGSTSPEGRGSPELNRRQRAPQELRLDKVQIGVTASGQADQVHEYGRLLNLNYFGELGNNELDRRRQELDIQDDELLRRAENVSVIYRYLEFQNRRDYDGIIDLHYNPYINKTFFGRWPISPEAHVRSLRGYFKLFPDATTEANKIIAAEGNIVTVRTTARGTQERELPGSMVGSSGKQIAVSLIHAIEVIDGRIASCETTNPFENQWTAGYVNSSFPGLGSDVSDIRARQGVDADYEILLERLYRSSRERGGAEENTLRLIERLVEVGPNQCQALVTESMRRCAKTAAPNSIYCEYHQEHGYGID